MNDETHIFYHFKDFAGDNEYLINHLHFIGLAHDGNYYYAMLTETQSDVERPIDAGDVTVATIETVRTKLDPIDGARLWKQIIDPES